MTNVFDGVLNWKFSVYYSTGHGKWIAIETTQDKFRGVCGKGGTPYEAMESLEYIIEEIADDEPTEEG